MFTFDIIAYASHNRPKHTLERQVIAGASVFQTFSFAALQNARVVLWRHQVDKWAELDE